MVTLENEGLRKDRPEAVLLYMSASAFGLSEVFVNVYLYY